METPAVADLVFAGVSFSYGRRQVLDGFDWLVPGGKTVLLGPNGAGKTTLLALAADVLTPSRGHVSLDNLSAGNRRDRRRYRSSIGWMPQDVRPVPGFTCREQVAYAGWLKGLSRSDAWQASLPALQSVGLTALVDRSVGQLSGGELRRVGIAQMLIHRASVVLLDEPTVGLDPVQRTSFRETLAALGVETRVVVSTHQVDDLTELFDHVAVLDAGRLRFLGSVREFMSRAEGGAPRPGESAYARIMSNA